MVEEVEERRDSHREKQYGPLRTNLHPFSSPLHFDVAPAAYLSGRKKEAPALRALVSVKLAVFSQLFKSFPHKISGPPIIGNVHFALDSARDNDILLFLNF